MNVYICTLKARNSDDQKTVSLVGSPDANTARKLIRGGGAAKDTDILVMIEPQLRYLGDVPAIIRKL